MKWIGIACATVLAIAWALSSHAASAQEARDPLVDPAQGAAGSRFQVVGQTGWTPGTTVTISFGFSDTEPGAAYDGGRYHTRDVTVLRDGTWSFPVVVNQDLFPFPLWRPGYIVVDARSGGHVAVNSFVYTVEGRTPAGLPPLANLGAGPGVGLPAWALTLALFMLGCGGLFAVSGSLRRGTLHDRT